jgi:hypothetical protein
VGLIDEKTRGRKSRETAPLNELDINRKQRSVNSACLLFYRVLQGKKSMSSVTFNEFPSAFLAVPGNFNIFWK